MLCIHEISVHDWDHNKTEDETSSENEDERSLSELAERVRASFDKWYLLCSA